MAFNFQLKNQSYQIALSKTKESFLSNDMEMGTYYLEKAIGLANELYANCVVAEIKARIQSEYSQLIKIKEIVDGGRNPFLKTATATNGAPSNGNSNNNQGGGEAGASGKEDEKKGEKYFTKESPKTTLADIAGLEDVKEQIRLNVLLPLNNPELFYKYKDDAGCKILMYGPPGCGKSFVAEAIAGELKCAYAIINASDIMDKYVGEAPKKLVAIFKEAETYDNCLLFFDEIDALCASRESDDSSHTKDILTTFLTCLSGFGTNAKKDSIKVIIAATNRPWALDSAMLRGKRLDNQIYVTLPDAEARKFMINKAFKKHMELLENTDIDLDYMTERTEGYSGADITSIINDCTTIILRKASTNYLNGINQDEVLTKEIFDGVMAKKRNSVTPESLQAFEAFRNGEI